MNTAKTFRWAILGTGAVARKFALDVMASGMEVATVASRNPDNAKAFAETLGLAAHAADYAEAVGAEVDAVYIATPAALHESHAMMAIEAGRAVLVEKPMASDPDAAARIVEAAETAGVFLMEALWTRFQPLPRRIRKMVAAGKIGEVLGFEARFGAANIPDPAQSLFDPDRGGGTLLHRGIYPLSMAHYLLGPITRTETMARIGETGVDEDTVLMARHASGAVSTLRSSSRSFVPDGAVIYGLKATLEIEGPIWRPQGAILHPANPSGPGWGGARKYEAFREGTVGVRLSNMLQAGKRSLNRARRRISAPYQGNGYRHQAEAVRDAVQAGQTRSEVMPPEESVEILRLIAEALDGAEAK